MFSARLIRRPPDSSIPFQLRNASLTSEYVGIVEIVREGYPDPTAFDPDAKYYDPKSDPAAPRWFMVDVRYKRRLKRVVSLRELKQLDDPRLADLPLLRKGNRLSVMPVDKAHWDLILELEQIRP